MSLPPSLLAIIEAHSCFSGCYTHGGVVWLTQDPAASAVKSYDVSCEDCLMFRVGALASVLPAGYDHYQLARDLSAHMLRYRGYTWAISGYHVSSGSGPGFWLSAASFGNGVLLVDSARNSTHSARTGSVNDLDFLLRAFREKLAVPEDPGMLDPKLYTAETVYLHLSTPLGAVCSKQNILSSPHCSRIPKKDHHRVTVLEFLPLVQATTAMPASAGLTSTPSPPTPTLLDPDDDEDEDDEDDELDDASIRTGRALALGERCPACGAEVMRRQLLTEFFIGCLC